MNKEVYIRIVLVIASIILQSQALLHQATGQEKNNDERLCKCDFSKYKPFVMSHVLPNAVLERVEPDYPNIAKAANAQGKVEVRILINRDGHVVDACVVDGHPLLRAAAKSAALRWKFKKNFGLTKKQKRRHLEASLFFDFVLPR